MKLTSGITIKDGFDGVTDRTGIFAEDSGSRCGTGGTSLSSRMCGVHVHDVLGRVISVVVDFISLFAVVPPEEFGREERTTGESELFIVGDIYMYLYCSGYTGEEENTSSLGEGGGGGGGEMDGLMGWMMLMLTLERAVLSIDEEEEEERGERGKERPDGAIMYAEAACGKSCMVWRT